MRQPKILKIILLVSILGIMVSGYLVNLHYTQKASPCDFSQTFSCSIVNQSNYAEFLGIPVALFGLGGYLVIGLISLSLWKRFQFKNPMIKKFISPNTLLYLSLGAVFASLYLTYAEFFVIKTICLLCLVSQGSVLAIAGLSYQNLRLDQRGDQNYIS
tara:strand:- start:464 stop:937 length:474 start_codon:yes stop_codon:yes gene_type:complete